ncbi:MAG: hypothetical protein IIA67_08710 [Planctomycetes bacterium]|nr:hypothetical protein [Planctomycetota bacterium]
MRITALLIAALSLTLHSISAAESPKRTTLSDTSIKYTVPKKPYAILKRGDVTAVVVDNRAVDDEVLKGHAAGYSGVAKLTHKRRTENLFVPAYAGLNYEHIHDGTVQPRTTLFEPRHAPMELRRIDEHTVELYQQPTPHYGLESVLRYRMLADGTIEMTLECIPRRRTFKNGYIGLFWASYIHQPESLDIHFLGHKDGTQERPRWIRGVTPAHGKLSTHPAAGDTRRFVHDKEFPLTLVFNRSQHRYDAPWYYGVSGGMALAMIFRSSDQVRMTQSPSGGGRGNPAWDFQYFAPNYKIGQRYQMVMRAMYVPFESREQMAKAAKRHVEALNK